MKRVNWFRKIQISDENSSIISTVYISISGCKTMGRSMPNQYVNTPCLGLELDQLDQYRLNIHVANPPGVIHHFRMGKGHQVFKNQLDIHADFVQKSISIFQPSHPSAFPCMHSYLHM